MTFIRFRTFEADGVTPIGSRTAGSIFCVPTARHTDLIGLVLPVPFQVVLDGLPKTVNLMPTALNWIWSFREDVAGAGVTRYCTVPNSTLTLDYENLTDIDPATLDPAALPEAAWWAAINKQVGLIIQSGGSYPAPLPAGYAGYEFRGSVDPATQFTLTGDYIHRWVRTP